MDDDEDDDDDVGDDKLDTVDDRLGETDSGLLRMNLMTLGLLMTSAEALTCLLLFDSFLLASFLTNFGCVNASFFLTFSMAEGCWSKNGEDLTTDDDDDDGTVCPK